MPTTFYLPPHQNQYTGDPCQGSGCWGAVGAWAVDGGTGGKRSPSPDEFRAKAGGGSGKPNPVTGCGTGLIDDWQKGLEAYGVPHWRRNVVPLAEAEAIFSDANRRGLYLVETDYDQWPAELKCSSPNFDGNHAVGIVPGVTVRGVRTMNSVCSTYQRVPIADVLRSAEKYSRAHGVPAGAIRFVKVPRLEVPEEEPLPPDPVPALKLRLREAKARIGALEAQLEARDETLAELRVMLLDGVGIIDGIGGV